MLIERYETKEKEVVLTTKLEGLDFDGLKREVDKRAGPIFQIGTEKLDRLDLSSVPKDIVEKGGDWKDELRKKNPNFVDKLITDDTLHHRSPFQPVVDEVLLAAHKWRLAYIETKAPTGNTVKKMSPHVTDEMAEPIVTQLWGYIVLGYYNSFDHSHWPNHLNFCLYLEADPEDHLVFEEIGLNFEPERGSLIMWRGNLDHVFTVSGANERYTLAGSVNYQKNPENFITKLGKKVINRITG